MRFLSFAGMVGLLVAQRLAHSQTLLRAGCYAETPPPSAVLWVGRSVVLHDDQTFAYQQWSDDLASNRYGLGTYQVDGQQLRLLFAVPVPNVSQARMQSLPARADSLALTFLVEMADTTRGFEIVPFASVMVYGTGGRVLASGLTDATGHAALRVAYSQLPQLLHIGFLGMKSWQQPAPVRSTAYRVRLAPNLGEPYSAGTVKILQVQQHKGRLALHDEGSQYPLLWQPDK